MFGFELSKGLAERHRILREQLKMSQEEMSERSGVSFFWILYKNKKALKSLNLSAFS